MTTTGTILGTSGADTVTASQSGTRIIGFGGNDTLRGGNGDDVLTGDSPYPPGDADILAGVLNAPAFKTWAFCYGAQTDTAVLSAASSQMLVIPLGRDAQTTKLAQEIPWTAQQIATIKASHQVYGYLDVAKINTWQSTGIAAWDPRWTSDGWATGTPVTGIAPEWLIGGQTKRDTALADFSVASWKTVLRERILELINRNYDGAFLDDVGEYYARVSSGLSNKSIAASARDMRDLVIDLRNYADSLRPPDASGNRFRLITNGDPYILSNTSADASSPDIVRNDLFGRAIDSMLLENQISTSQPGQANPQLGMNAQAKAVEFARTYPNVTILSVDIPLGNATVLTEAQRLKYITGALSNGFLPYTPDTYLTLAPTFLEILNSANAGPHDDVLDGGPGVNTATYSGLRSDYSVTALAGSIIRARPPAPGVT